MDSNSNNSFKDRMIRNTATESFLQQFLPDGREEDKVRVVIIDDEALARRAVRRAVEIYPNAKVIAECSDGSEALRILQNVRPDLVFLDVEMPQMDGFEVVRKLDPQHAPYIVFVTAHERYALDAFKIHAIDYLVKPIDEGKIQEVLQRVSGQVKQNRLRGFNSELDSIIQLIEKRDTGRRQSLPLERIAVKNKDRFYFVETSAIDWIEADRNYVILHSGSTKHILRMKMNHLEERLDPSVFIRIHRSSIVNIRSVKEFRLYFNGMFMILLKDGSKLFSSRGYHDRVEQIVNRHV